MNRRKRRYTPKIKGCYECSQRRIDCDRGEPTCAKCVDKGIPCSGLGLRYRFSDDVASKSRIGEKGKSGGLYRTSVAYAVGIDVLQDVGLELGSDGYDEQRACLDEPYDDSDHQVVSSDTPLMDPFAGLTDTAYESQVGADGSVSPTSHQAMVGDLTRYSRPIPQAICDSSDPWKRFLLTYFANNIAPELVVIDGQQNGWRHLVLPIAGLDDLVMDAVLSASAFHFSVNVSDQFYKPNVVYASTIKRLQQRQNLEAQDIVGKQTVLLALLVLLATVMVNGGSDFPTVFNLLESAVRAVGGEEATMQGELGRFVVRQIRKYRGYAAPLRSQAEGIARLSLTASFGPDTADGWECFKSYYQSHPEFSQSMSIIYELNRQACDIYVARALATPQTPPFTSMVQRFIDTMDSYPTDCPGEHTLVFATFLAAAESELPEHQEYFLAALLKHHQRNGFTNIPLAMDYLRWIWSECQGQNWTQLLPDLHIFVV